MTKHSPIKAVIWDLSGVLTIEEELDDLEFPRQCGLSVENWRAIGRDYFIDRQAWDRVERGEQTLGEFSETLSKLVSQYGGECSPEKAGTIWGDPDPFTASSGIRGDIINLIHSLRHQNTICLCTNNIREWREIWESMIPVKELFHHVFDSSEIGQRKPETGFWRHMEEVLGLQPHEILFVDDRMNNVTGARDHGWNAVQFLDSPSLIKAISEFIEIEPIVAIPAHPAQDRGMEMSL